MITGRMSSDLIRSRVLSDPATSRLGSLRHPSGGAGSNEHGRLILPTGSEATL
jgi:hypothetical protein